MQPAPKLPTHDEFTRWRRIWEAFCIAAAVALLVGSFVRLGEVPQLLGWWMLLPIVCGMVVADITSGLVHWTADTWGSETMPILGRRFVRPFRVHHVNPDDFLRRSFLDTNGDVAMIVSFFLVGAFFIPLTTTWGQIVSIGVVAFCVAGLPTNQVHQWAHMRRPPRCVRWLQRRGLILSRAAHERHHHAPYAMNYCIATGWCNGLLTYLSFFRRMETLITWLTGLRPRADDAAFQASVVICQGAANSTAVSAHD
jgi:plasmanylethanolamine desaturase